MLWTCTIGSGRYKYILISPSHTVSLPSNNQQSPIKATKQQQDPSTKTHNSLPPSLPSFNYPTHNKSSPYPRPNPQTTNHTHTHARNGLPNVPTILHPLSQLRQRLHLLKVILHLLDARRLHTRRSGFRLLRILSCHWNLGRSRSSGCPTSLHPR